MRIVNAAFALLLALGMSGCGVNPVTGERELQLISESQEIQMGEQYYGLAQQSEGGDFDELPQLSKYVNAVGQKLAAVADRDLPYEFVVLNNSVPNAWALPGGKIAINRGLLTELDNEAELAAVLGHEIVHAAARHGARAQERGTLLQAGLALAQIGAAVGDVDQNVAGLLLQGASVGAQLVQTKYSREQELEADRYGMQYMKEAGYDPTGAVTLQKQFVRLAQKEKRQENWLEGLFASHPPSQERVAQNLQTLQRVGAGGELGEQQYAATMAPLRKMEPAYDKHEEALAAARRKEFDRARELALEAARMYPQEGRFHQLLGDLSMAQERPEAALPHYHRAIDRNADYFGSYLGAGIAQFRTGNEQQAEDWLEKSMKLLPTAPAAYYLGTIAQNRGDLASAADYYKMASGSDNQYGRKAAAELVRMNLSQHPQEYVATGAQLDASGRVVLVVVNRSPVPLTGIRVTPVLVDPAGRVVREASPVVIREVVNPNERVAGDAGIGVLPRERLSQLRFRVDAAQVAGQ